MGGKLLNIPEGFPKGLYHFMTGLESILNEGTQSYSYTQVSYDFKLDSIKKLVLTEILSVFPSFILPCLKDTLYVWHQWIGIFKGYPSVRVSRWADHSPSIL